MSQPFLKRTKNNLIYIAARVFVGTLAYFPLPLLGFIGGILGRLGFVLARKEREKSLRHLRMAFGDSKTESELKAIASASWANLGRNGFEMIGWSRWSHERIASQVERVVGWEHAERALARGKGVMAMTAHLGHWELLAAYVGFRTPIAVVAKPLYDPRLDKMITDFRGKWGGPVIPRGGALKGILKALSQNRVIGLLMDQDTGDDGVFVPFFGRETWAQSGPARIAKKSGAALVPFFLVRNHQDRFELLVEPEIPVGEGEDAIRDATAAYTALIEKYVRAYPEQWVWMHERWKTRPEDRKI
jgi:KDO2-lipid IV(A) lauroyltransferase